MSGINVSRFVQVCKNIVDIPCHQGTPREKYNIRQLLDADARGDAEEVARWAEHIHQQFQYLNDTFQMVMFVHLLRCRVGLNLVIIILNETAPQHAQLPPAYPNFQLSYGSVEQQYEAWAGDEGPRTSVLEDLAIWRKGIERHTFHELLLDHEYVTKRMQAACSSTNLTDKLVQDRDWDGLAALLDQDEAVCDTLIPWLSQSPDLYLFLQTTKQLIISRIAHLRSILNDPPEVSSEPPPAYSTTDPNAPSTLPSLPAAILTYSGIDLLRQGFRLLFDRQNEN